MLNKRLATDYLRRAGARLLAIDALFEAESWADVVRESQEVVELTLKALLRVSGVEPPRVHDVSDVLEEARGSLPASILPHLAQLTSASRRLRRDRELAFYGAEDLTPSEFYSRADADEARVAARNVVSLVERFAFSSGTED